MVSLTSQYHVGFIPDDDKMCITIRAKNQARRIKSRNFTSQKLNYDKALVYLQSEVCQG